MGKSSWEGSGRQPLLYRPYGAQGLGGHYTLWGAETQTSRKADTLTRRTSRLLVPVDAVERLIERQQEAESE